MTVANVVNDPELVKGSALDIPAKPSTSSQRLLARFARRPVARSPQRVQNSRLSPRDELVRNGRMPAVCALVVGLIVTFVATAFVREWEVRERRDLVAQTSAEHVEALNGPADPVDGGALRDRVALQRATRDQPHASFATSSRTR